MATWTFDGAHTCASFSARHMMVTTVRGMCDKVTGTLIFDPEHPENSSVDAVIDATSLATGVADRDAHLRSADFLETDTYPTITFKSTNVKLTGKDTADVTGDLTIRNVTRPVTLKVEHLGLQKGFQGDQRAGFTARTKINREDWGLTWNVAIEAGGVLVGKEIAIDLDVEAIQVPETETAAAAV